MKRYNGAAAEKIATREQLPVGGYEVKIISAKEEVYDWGTRLAIAFDIAEGEHKGFYQKDFDNQQGEDKKWRGVYRIYEPKDDGSQNDAWTKRKFNNFIYCLEDSNLGYHLDWAPLENGDFSQFKGKMLGLLFRSEEWEMNNNGEYRTGWSTRPFSVLSVGDIRDGNYKTPKDKPLKEKAASANNFAPLDDDDDGDVPF